MIPRASFLTSCGIIATCCLFTIQCTWTPDVKTPIHSSAEGNVALQTSSNFKIPPQHPAELSETLITQLLQGIAQRQEQGILQELFISDSKASPVFSPTQIAFLAPHLADAFSQATPEELITFRSLGHKEGSGEIRGTMAVFSPTIFLLTFQQHYQKNPTRTTSSTRILQSSLSLIYSEKQAIVQPEEAQRFMTISSKIPWIAINYGDLSLRHSTENHQDIKLLLPPPQPTNTQADLNTLQEQVEGLRQTIEDQAEEIQRLQKIAPR